MTNVPDWPDRRSIRLPAYDYSAAGAYFLTICTQGRLCLLADIAAGELRVNPAGQMVNDIWSTLPTRFPDILLDSFVVMPNHVHCILILTQTSAREPGIGRGDSSAGGCPTSGQPTSVPHGTLPGTVGRIIQAFKSLTTHAYILGVKSQGWSPFPGQLWQRNYYERIIRNQLELSAIRQYILDNPTRWAMDMENPEV